MRVLILLQLVFITLVCNGQILEHLPLWSKGEVPKEFLQVTDDIFEEVEAKTEKGDFDIDSKITIKEMLESGIILFGDSVSEYVQALGNQILKRNEIDQIIKFYVLRAPIFNAYSFDQGSIFVSVGAIAGCANEDELAFVLCHELVHYLNKHSYESFNKRNQIDQFDEESLNERLLDYFKYSRENELEADESGVSLYLQAGFNRKYLKGAITNLAPHSEWFEGYKWSVNYLEDKFFAFPDFYTNPDSMHLSKYQDLFNSETKLVKSKRDESADSNTILKNKYTTHPDWKTRLNEITEILNTLEVSASVEASKKVSTDFYRINELCRWELIYYFFTSGNYLRAHYYSLELESIYGKSKDLTFFRTISLNNLYYAYYDLSNDKKVATPITDIAKNGQPNILNMLRFFDILNQKEWAAILVRENYKLFEDFPENYYVKRYLNYALQELSSQSNNNYSVFMSQTKESDAFGVTKNDFLSVRTELEVREKYLKSALQFIQEVRKLDQLDSLNTIAVSTFLEKNIDKTILSKSMTFRTNDIKNRSNYKGDELDTIILIDTEIRAFKHSKRSFKPNPRQTDILESQYVHHLKKAAKNLDIHLKGTSFKDKSSSSAESWNNQYRLTSWLNERAQNQSAAIAPIHSMFLNQNGALPSSGIVMYTFSTVYNNGKGYNSRYLFLKPVLDPLLAIFLMRRSQPRIYLINIIADTRNNKLILIQIEKFKTNITKDFVQAQMYHLMYEAKTQLHLYEN